MKFLEQSSLQRKQTLIIMLTSGVALLLACLLFAGYELITFRQSLVGNLSILAEIVGNNSKAALDFNDPRHVEEVLSALKAEEHVRAAVVYTREGRIFAVYHAPGGPESWTPPSVRSDRHDFSGHSLHLFRAIDHKGEFLGTVYLESDLTALTARLQRYALIAACVFGLASLVALALSSRLQRLVSAPILHMVHTARRVAQDKNYSLRAVKQSQDELGVLVDSFNEMLAQIQVRDVELRGAKDALEFRVEERTRALRSEVAERRRTEEELLKAKEAAESATRAKSEFLANMSHEIRTPMNGVLGMLGLLQDSELSERQREFVQIARSSAESLLIILNDILDFSKIEAGKLSVEPLPFDLREVVEEVSELFALRAANKKLDLIVRYATAAPRRALADPGRVRQVLTNLVGNAIKFTSTGHVLVDVQSPSEPDGPDRLTVSVQDTGIGIPRDQLERIFEKFTQADASTTRRFGGTGLGLAISRQLVELMGGQFGVSSEPGRGSTFWFTLPLSVPDKTTGDTHPGSSLDGVRVLLVDDNEVNRRVLQEQVTGWRMLGDSVPTAEAALAAMRKAHAGGDPYAIAILDFQMPGMDGETLARAIKADPALGDTAVIILTSGDHPIEPARLKEARIFTCLVKPVRQSRLRDVLEAAWKSRHQTSWTRLLPRPAAPRPGSVADRGPARATPVRVLVTDDNPTNQRVARLMLEKLGCEVEVASHGRESVAKALQFAWEVILMDCEMPEMDGFEATREIRRLEKTRVPIIAMTAKAIQGDREACLAAGMDDYISKPVRLEALQQALERWAPGNPDDARPEAGPGPDPQPDPVPSVSGAEADDDLLDPAAVERLRSLASGDPAVLAEIYRTFLASAAKYQSALREAIQAGDPGTLARAAHAFKGAGGSIGAKSLWTICAELESLGRSGWVDGAGDLLRRLELEAARVKARIEEKHLKPSLARAPG